MVTPPAGRLAMVSGAGRGIGAAIARELAAAGFRLSLGLRDPARLPGDLAAAADLVFAYDALADGAGRAWVTATLAAAGRIDVLVNNAGISEPLELMEDPPLADAEAAARLDRLLAVNVRAPFLLTRAAMPHLCATGGGRIVTVASMSGKRVLGSNAGYQVTKHAAVALAHAARRAGWDHGLRGTALCPGFVATDMIAQHTHLDRAEITQPEDLAKLVAHVIQLPNSTAVAELLVNWRYEPGY